MTANDMKISIRLALLSLDRDPNIALPTRKVALRNMLGELRTEQRAIGGILK